MNILLVTTALIFTQAFAFMSCPSFIEVDGMEVSIPLTAHDSFATPDCKSLGLLASSDLKCDDGNWVVYNPEADEKYSLTNSPFSICIDGALFGMEEESTGNVDHLRKFWETVRSSFSEADNCPTEALECYTFDVFGERYERNGGVLDQSFIDLIPLDTPSKVEYLATVGQNVREFVFYNGLIGRVIELDSGVTYTTLNADDVEDFQLFIHPVTLEGGNLKYVIYREDTSEEVVTGEADNQGERRKLTRQDALNVEFLQERLLQAPEHQRRMLRDTDLITVTFMYDATIQSYSDARASATDIVINLNKALGPNFDYQVVLKAVVRATDGSLNPGSQTSECVVAGVYSACTNEHNKLPTSERGDIFHCFVANGAFKDPTVGCAGEGGAGVTEIGHSFSTAIGVHEIGHQLAADHDKSECWCALEDFGWDFGCFCFKWKGCKIEWCTTMNPKIKSSTGHVVRMQFSDDNRREARRVSSYANIQHDAITWTHCGNENEVCRCDGTVRYGANGRWASPRPVHGQISCSNSVFGDPIHGVRKRCECTTPAERWENIGLGNCLRAPSTSAYVTGYSWIGVTTNDADPRWSASTSEYNRCREVCENDPQCTGYQQSGTQQSQGGTGNCVIFNVPITGAQDLGDWWLYSNCYRRVPGW